MAFMTPEYWFGKMYTCPDSEAGPYPSDYFTKEQVEDLDDCHGEVEEEIGWWCRLSASGYSDATEWSGPYETEREAREAIMDMFEVHPDTGDEMDWDYVDEQVIERILNDVQHPDHATHKKRGLFLWLPSWRTR